MEIETRVWHDCEFVGLYDLDDAADNFVGFLNSSRERRDVSVVDSLGAFCAAELFVSNFDPYARKCRD